ncbi:hypothetical protein LCGC14_1047180 [marine sediment metagenome]|uniref:Uncharacterized protein n=1 Tax=marine sediment metagenome TaxID=412755 RepID=A0A0F9NBT0_9ZZZZ
MLDKLKIFKRRKIEDIEENEITIFRDMVTIKFRMRILLFLMGLLITFIVITSFVNMYLMNKLVEIIG